MAFTIHPLADTGNYVIRQRSRGAGVVLVAEVVQAGSCYTVLRMDETGVLAEGLPSPLSALCFYMLWVRDTGPTILGIDVDADEARSAGIEQEPQVVRRRFGR